MNYSINTVEELEERMKCGTVALKNHVPRDGKDRFCLMTSRYSSNLQVDPVAGKAFVDKHRATFGLIVIHYDRNTDIILMKKA